MTAMSKLAYLAIIEYPVTQPVVIRSHHQYHMTLDNPLMQHAADDNNDCFLNIE